MWYDAEEVRTQLQAADGVSYREAGLSEGIDHLAGEIAEGRPMAWVDGRAEHGPRALGSRSIISPASSDEHRRHLNDKVKFRERFRPVAPFTTVGRAAEYFDVDGESPYMMYIVPCTDKAAAEIPAAVHIDRTAGADSA
jgi:carbamoyltransferase